MGANRLDGISRALASGVSRRQALRQIGLVLAGGAAVVIDPEAASAAGSMKCAKTQTTCCVTLATDPNNCGACGHVCSLPNATAACVNSVCQISACNAGFGNCNGIASDGCEANFSTDVNNCGGCGRACSPGQSCVAGTCTSPTLPPGSSCTVDSQCTSGVCGGGFCCTAACPDTGTCGSIGVCDATGACRDAPKTTECGVPSCSGSVFTPASFCDGTGNCVPSTPVDCSATGKTCTVAGCV